MKTFKLPLDFLQLELPVAYSRDGTELVPLFPLIEALGLNPVEEASRMNEEGLLDRFGATMSLKSKTSPIFIKRTLAIPYLMQVDLDLVQAGKKPELAELLLHKMKEWADVLHKHSSGSVISELEHLAQGNLKAVGAVSKADWIRKKQAHYDQLIHEYEVRKAIRIVK